MTREELKAHCEKQIEMCEIWARCKEEEPHGKIYEEHKLILELLEQETVSKESYDHEYFLRKELEMKIAKLEQQEPILDKIRAEVENINVWGMRYNPDTDKDIKPQIVQKVKNHVIEILDKYMAESE